MSSPLDLRAVFARPWSGPAVLWRPWWLRWLPIPRTFEFRSEILNVTNSAWDVRDTTTFPDGTAQVRTMRCTQLAEGHLRLNAVDMPGGADVTVGPDGFSFSPYTIRTPVIGPLPISLQFFDSVRLEPGPTMIDEIELRYLGVAVDRITMRLRPGPGPYPSRL